MLRSLSLALATIVAFLLCCLSPLRAEDSTLIAITDKVLVSDCIPMGTNFDTVDVKKPIAFTFEGSSHRICSEGELFADGFMAYLLNKEHAENYQLADFYRGGTITILSSAAQGEQRKIVRVDFKKRHSWPWNVGRNIVSEQAFFVFDRPIQGLPEEKRTDLAAEYQKGKERAVAEAFKTDPTKNVGALIERNYLDTGFFGYTPPRWLPDRRNATLSIVHGDVPPGSFGGSALLVEPEEGKTAKLLFSPCNHASTDCNAIYHVTFWAKARSGKPELSLRWEDPEGIPEEKLALKSEWSKHSLRFDHRGKFPATPPSKPASSTEQRAAKFALNLQGGSVLLDDMEVDVEGDRNPTPFRDDPVETLKRFNTGIVRLLIEGGDTMENELSPRMRQHMYEGSLWLPKLQAEKTTWFSTRRFNACLHDYYLLAEHLHCGAWYGITGTVYPQEIDILMEYLGAPAEVGYGKLRAAQGHPQPWTETLPRIYIEFGNEIWNFVGDYKVSSYAGRDYWDGLIRRAKQSPYYKLNVLFVMGVDGNFEVVPSADLVMNRAPYVVHDLPQGLIDKYPTKKALYEGLFAQALEQNVFGEKLAAKAQAAAKTGQGLAVYEVNYHITKPDDTLAVRNELVTSIAGGVNMANAMLGMLKQHKVRHQCFFNYAGNYNQTRLWGGVINHRIGNERYRPSWLALTIANQIIASDLLETTHSGADPKFTAMTIRGGNQVTFPVLHSYAFRGGKQRGVVLVNLDLDCSHKVVLQFVGKPAGPARKYQLAAADYTANNEPEHEAQVWIEESQLKDFHSGQAIELPPCALVALRWEQ